MARDDLREEGAWGPKEVREELESRRRKRRIGRGRDGS